MALARPREACRCTLTPMQPRSGRCKQTCAFPRRDALTTLWEPSNQRATGRIALDVLAPGASFLWRTHLRWPSNMLAWRVPGREHRLSLATLRTRPQRFWLRRHALWPQPSRFGSCCGRSLLRLARDRVHMESSQNIYKTQHSENKYSATGTRTRVARVRAEYPNQLDYSGSCFKLNS